MKDCRLIDELELPLKSIHNFEFAASHAIELGLGQYLEKMICPLTGDWPAQFYMRKLQFNTPENVPLCLQNIVLFIGPLHVQLNARECLCCLNIELFKTFYASLFGKKKKLTNKPKPWRIALVLELLYGGWTLIRDEVLVAFAKCKDIQYLTFLNILDNYLPAVLSVYSVIFKSWKMKQYNDSLLRLWVLFFCYRRHHYNKAPLVWLSNFLFWKHENHPLFHALMEHLNAFDEYPVENFHSHLRAQTRECDNAEILRQKARAMDEMKGVTSSFTSTFSVPRKYSFKQSKLEELKVSAAQFICSQLANIKDNLGCATIVERPNRRKKDMTYWKLPHLYGDETVVGSKVLPLGFQFPGDEPDPEK